MPARLCLDLRRRYSAPMTWQEFWSTIFPDYLGALGSIAASTVAVAAFIRDMRTRAGLKEMAQAAASTIELPSPGAGGSPAAPTIAPPFRVDTEGSAPQGEPLIELTTRGKQTVLRNLSTEPIRISDLRVPSGGKEVTLRSELPAAVEPGEGFGFVVHDLLRGPAITALLVEWVDGGGTPHLSRFYV